MATCASPGRTRAAAPTAASPRSPIRTGTRFLLQQITQRLPGRVWGTDIGELADLLHETSQKHGAFEAVAPKHNWWDWYAAYLDARRRGSSPDEAAAAAGRYMADVKHVVVS